MATNNAKVLFGFTNDKEKAKAADNDMVVFVKPNKTGGKGIIVFDKVEYGGEGETFGTNETAEVEVGGLAKDTDLEGKSAKQVLDEILHPTYAPYYVEPTATLSVSGDLVREVGTNLPSKDDYAGGGTSAKVIGKADTYEATNGTPSFTLSIDTNSANNEGKTDAAYGTTTTKAGIFKVINTATCALGSTTVKDSKGNVTNKVAGSASERTLLSNADADTKYIQLKADSQTDYVVKNTTKTEKVTITYLYKVYASTASDGTLTAQALTNSKSDSELTLIKDLPMIVAIPNSYTNVQIQEKNLSGSWENATSNYNTENLTKKDAAGNDVTYVKYTRKNSDSSNVKIKIVFTPY